MGNFDRPRSGGFSRGNSGFGGGRSFGGRDSGRFERRPVEMHDATCDKCKKQCQVPFRPSGDKPVLCSDCFRNAGSGNSFDSRDRGRSSSGTSSGMTSDQFKVLNVKLDKILHVLSTLEIAEDEDSDGEDLEISDEESSEDSDADSGNDKDLDDNADDDLDDSEEPKTA